MCAPLVLCSVPSPRHTQGVVSGVQGAPGPESAGRHLQQSVDGLLSGEGDLPSPKETAFRAWDSSPGRTPPSGWPWCLVAAGGNAKRRKNTVAALAPGWLGDNLGEGSNGRAGMDTETRPGRWERHCGALKTGLFGRVCLGVAEDPRDQGCRRSAEGASGVPRGPESVTTTRRRGGTEVEASSSGPAPGSVSPRISLFLLVSAVCFGVGATVVSFGRPHG